MTESDIDHCVDLYENAWTVGGAVPDLLTFCQNYAGPLTLAAPERQELLLELAAVDMELRWRRECQGGRRAIETRSLDWYRHQLAAFGLGESELRTLAINELEVRSRWGDRPEIDSLVAAQYPLASSDRRSEIENELRDALELRFPVLCTVSSEMVQRFRVSLKTPCLVGRRRALDPPDVPTYYEQLERRWRMVIAGREENSISREQMLIRRISVDTIEVIPQSEKVSCYVDDIRLPKRQSTIISISKPAALLRCGGIVVHLRRA